MKREGALRWGGGVVGGGAGLLAEVVAVAVAVDVAVAVAGSLLADICVNALPPLSPSPLLLPPPPLLSQLLN